MVARQLVGAVAQQLVETPPPRRLCIRVLLPELHRASQGRDVVKRSHYAFGPAGDHGLHGLSLHSGHLRGGLEQVAREELRIRRRRPGSLTEAEADAAAACQGRAKRRRKRTPPAEQPPHLTGGRR